MDKIITAQSDSFSNKPKDILFTKQQLLTLENLELDSLAYLKVTEMINPLSEQCWYHIAVFYFVELIKVAPGYWLFNFLLICLGICPIVTLQCQFMAVTKSMSTTWIIFADIMMLTQYVLNFFIYIFGAFINRTVWAWNGEDTRRRNVGTSQQPLQDDSSLHMCFFSSLWHNHIYIYIYFPVMPYYLFEFIWTIIQNYKC